MNTPSNKSDDQESDIWKSLEKSYLSGICREVQTSRRHQSLRRSGLTLMLVLLTTGLGVWGVSRATHQGAGNVAHIPCSVVQANHLAFLAGTLDVDLTSQIEAHIEKCARCRAMLAEMRSSDAGRIPSQNDTASLRHVPIKISSLLLAKQ